MQKTKTKKVTIARSKATKQSVKRSPRYARDGSKFKRAKKSLTKRRKISGFAQNAALLVFGMVFSVPVLMNLAGMQVSISSADQPMFAMSSSSEMKMGKVAGENTSPIPSFIQNEVIVQEVSRVVNNNYNTVSASLSEAELVDIINSSSSLKTLLKGEKGDKGDQGPQGATGSGITYVNGNNSVGSVGGITYFSSKDISTKTLTVSEGLTLPAKSITFTYWSDNLCTADQIAKFNGSAWACASDDSGVNDAQYLTLAANATLTAERVLTGTTNQITLTDGGAGGGLTLSLPQNIHTGATPTFATLSLGTNPAQSGILRLPNAQVIVARNAANSADLQLIQLNSSNIVEVGAGNLTVDPASGGVTTLVNDLVFSGNKVIRRNTSDGSDNGFVVLHGGGTTTFSQANLRAQGASIIVTGNEETATNGAGQIQLRPGAAATDPGIRLYDNAGGSIASWSATDGSATFTSSKGYASVGAAAWTFNSTNATDGGLEIQESGTGRIKLRYDASNNLVLDSLTASSNLALAIAGTTIANWNSNGSAVFTATGEGANGHAWSFVDSKATSPVGIIVQYTGAAPNNTASPFFKCYDTGADPRCEIRSNGGIANYSANNVNLSDERMKNLYGEAPSELERFSRLKFVLGEYKDNPLEVKDVMLTAQQVQTVYPELVTVFSEETGTLGIREGALALRAYKAIQELHDRLSNLSVDKIVSISGKWSIDENGVLIVDTLKAKTVDTENFCMDGVCITKDEFKILLQNNGLLNQPQASSDSNNVIPELVEGSQETDSSSTTDVGTPETLETPAETEVPTGEQTE